MCLISLLSCQLQSKQTLTCPFQKKSINLNGEEFTNVLAAEEDAKKYYYSKTQGLVGFQAPDTI